MKKAILITIRNCAHCLKCETERTPGAGYALDYFCNATPHPRKLKGYVEHADEEPQDNEIPKWCPYPEAP